MAKIKRIVAGMQQSFFMRRGAVRKLCAYAQLRPAWRVGEKGHPLLDLQGRDRHRDAYRGIE